MNALKRWIMLFGLKRLPAASVYDICEKMRPFLKPYHLHLTETEIRFPERMSLKQFYEMKGNWSRRYCEGIPYNEIIIVEQCQKEVILYLRSGHVFTFNPDRPVWNVANVYLTHDIDQWKKQT